MKKTGTKNRNGFWKSLYFSMMSKYVFMRRCNKIVKYNKALNNIYITKTGTI